MRWSQPYLVKRGNRFSFRRRPICRCMVNDPITISLRTTDPAAARFICRQLAATWDDLMMWVTDLPGLTATERRDIFRRELDHEVGQASLYWGTVTSPEQEAERVGVLDAVFRFSLRNRLAARYGAGDFHHLCFRPEDDIFAAAEVLRRHGAVPHPSSDQINEAMEFAKITPASEKAEHVSLALWAARLEARRRCAKAAPIMRAGEWPEPAELVDDETFARKYADLAPRGDDPIALPTHVTSSARANAHPNSTLAAEPDDCPFMEREQRRFSELINVIIADKIAANEWSPDNGQRRRVLQAFAWITGDKPAHAYRPSDLGIFVRTMKSLPASFEWKEHLKPSSPRFADLEKPLPVAKPHETRSYRTFNRDLTIIKSAAILLGKGAWKPKYLGANIFDFDNLFQKPTREEKEMKLDRVPWTVKNVEALAQMPLYVGNCGAQRRLRAGKLVYQDGAYWVPLLIAYSGMSREEACGLEVGEIYLDVPVPFVEIRRNMTKSIDGINPAGLKNYHRKRLIPLHHELLRLGFGAYVLSRRQEGKSAALFPELYTKPSGERFSNRGGLRFYAGAGHHILTAVDSLERLPVTPDGERADFHSLRTYVYSMMCAARVPAWIAGDVVGHAREGTGQQKYNKPEEAIGRDEYLKILLDALETSLPNVTKHLQPRKLMMLNHSARSRTGKP